MADTRSTILEGHIDVQQVDGDGYFKDIEARTVAIFAAIQSAQLFARGRKDVRLFNQVTDAYMTVGLLS